MTATPCPPLSDRAPAGSVPDAADLVYHRLCRADELAEGQGRPLTVDGTHLAVFRYQGRYHAVDNRCPHMGYPMSEGTVRDGILICHWHHWEFDLKTGGCFLTAGDDLKVFPIELREDGCLYVGLARGEREETRRRLLERGRRLLEQGLKDRSSFLIAKAVIALRQGGAQPREIIQQGLYYGAHKTSEGWSSGVTILTLAANLWEEIDPDDQNLFLVHGLIQIANRASGSSRRQRSPLPRAQEDPEPATLKRWFRRAVDQRDHGTAERILITLHDRQHPTPVLADFVFTAATDFYFTGDGHALDFGNKVFEALDYVEWVGAEEILRPIVVDLVGRTRHEETSRWADSVPVLEETFTRLDRTWEENQTRVSPLDVAAFTQVLLGEELAPIVAELELRLRQGARPTDLCRAMTYAAAVRTARFHLKNEGDWHEVANIYSYAHALYRAFHRAPSRELLRGLFHGAAFLTYLRWLNMPAARVPTPRQRLSETLITDTAMLERLQELADFQKVYESELLVNQYLAEGHDPIRLWRALAHILLREDAELHMFQVLEVGRRHFDLSSDPEEKRIHLLAVTRYITAQKVMKSVLWSTQNAERLARGELLSQRADDD